MPTYEYRCSSCASRIEIVHSLAGGPPETCPACGAKDTLRKQFAPPAIVFKGSGWAKKERAAGAAKASSPEGDGKSAETEGKAAEGTPERARTETGGAKTEAPASDGGSAQRDAAGARSPGRSQPTAERAPKAASTER
jgi:putative FmdB family regulatory protein